MFFARFILSIFNNYIDYKEDFIHIVHLYPQTILIPIRTTIWF